MAAESETAEEDAGASAGPGASDGAKGIEEVTVPQVPSDNDIDKSKLATLRSPWTHDLLRFLKTMYITAAASVPLLIVMLALTYLQGAEEARIDERELRSCQEAVP